MRIACHSLTLAKTSQMTTYQIWKVVHKVDRWKTPTTSKWLEWGPIIVNWELMYACSPEHGCLFITHKKWMIILHIWIGVCRVNWNDMWHESSEL